MDDGGMGVGGGGVCVWGGKRRRSRLTSFRHARRELAMASGFKQQRRSSKGVHAWMAPWAARPSRGGSDTGGEIVGEPAPCAPQNKGPSKVQARSTVPCIPDPLHQNLGHQPPKGRAARQARDEEPRRDHEAVGPARGDVKRRKVDEAREDGVRPGKDESPTGQRWVSKDGVGPMSQR